MDSLTADNPLQTANLRGLYALIGEKLESMERDIRDIHIFMTPSASRKRIIEGIQKTNEIKYLISKLMKNESDLLEERSQKYSRFINTATLFIIFLFAGTFIILLTSYYRINKTYQHAMELDRIAKEHEAKVKETLISKKLLEESEKRYYQLIHTSPFAIGILYGEELVVTIANDPILAIWGKGKEIIGKKYFEALPELAEQGYREIFEQVYRDGIPYEAIETPVEIVQEGERTLKYYNFVLYPQRNIDNQVEGIGIIATEVTSHAILNNKVKESERKYRELSHSLEEKVAERTSELLHMNEVMRVSEERYHRMVEEVQDYAIILLSKEGIVQNWNKGAENIKGYKAEEIIGRSFSTFYTAGDRANHIPEKLLALAAEKGKATDENWRVRKDGSRFWGSVVITALRDDKNNIYGFVKVTRDLTERKNAEDVLRQSAALLGQKNADLEKMNKELESFTYISSHDLQEPLRKIQTFASRIREKEVSRLSDNGRDYFSRMQVAAQRMQTLIDDLLAYSRTKTADRKFEVIHLNEVVQDVKEDMKEELSEKHAVIETAELCDVTIIPFQFRQLIHNLIGNSLKFARPGIAPHITIKSRVEEGRKLGNSDLLPDKKYCHIHIEDNGIGFEQKYSEKIFEVFQRLHGREVYEGTGIGLSIVKKIIENHAGFITAKGELNRGAQFDIYLPA